MLMDEGKSRRDDCPVIGHINFECYFLICIAIDTHLGCSNINLENFLDFLLFNNRRFNLRYLRLRSHLDKESFLLSFIARAGTYLTILLILFEVYKESSWDVLG